MKGYRRFICLFTVLLAVLIVAETSRPARPDWSISLRSDDKNPYGTYILYHQLDSLFPSATVNTYREPAYNVLTENPSQGPAAYICIAPQIQMDKADIPALLQFVHRGNYALVSAVQLGKELLDTLGLEMATLNFPSLKSDSSRINFVYPGLRVKNGYPFRRLTIDTYFSSLKKTGRTTVLGRIEQNGAPDFVKVKYGSGYFLVHAAPLCFSNYFLLYGTNSQYVSGVFSYLPPAVRTVYWDNYYASGRTGAATPLRFILNNDWLLQAFRLSLLLLLLYVFSGMKRKQRIIPVIKPLRNTSVEFVKTVAALYFNKRDNRDMAWKKTQYWLEGIRLHYGMDTTETGRSFVTRLSHKSGVSPSLIKAIIRYIPSENTFVTDNALIELNKNIDIFNLETKAKG